MFPNLSWYLMFRSTNKKHLSSSKMIKKKRRQAKINLVFNKILQKVTYDHVFNFSTKLIMI